MTLLIRNVKIVDGGGGAPYAGDVFVSVGRISAVGSFPMKTADRVLDGQGGYLLPGMVDVHSEADHHFALFDSAGRAEVLRQGISAILGGQDGFSLAPWSNGQAELFRLRGGNYRNIAWSTMAEFLQFARKHPAPFAFQTLVGYRTLLAVAGLASKNPDSASFAVIENLLRRCLKEGAAGLSLDFGLGHTPRLNSRQLANLFTRVAEQGGIVSCSIPSSLAPRELEILLTARRTAGVKLLLIPSAMSTGLSDLTSLRIKTSGDRNIRLVLSPTTYAIRPLVDLLPEWARRSSLRKTKLTLADVRLRRKIAEELSGSDPGGIRVVKAGQTRDLLGLTLTELMALYEVPDPGEALVRLMRIVGLSALVRVEHADLALVRKELGAPGIFWNGGHPNLFTDRVPVHGYDIEPSFVRVLAWALAAGEEAFGQAVAQLARLPAEFLNLSRGEIRPGRPADMALFREGEMRQVFIGGVSVWRE